MPLPTESDVFVKIYEEKMDLIYQLRKYIEQLEKEAEEYRRTIDDLTRENKKLKG